MAVQKAAGLEVPIRRKRINLSALRRKARAGRKQGRKRGLDSIEVCAPDSVQAKRTLTSVAEEVTIYDKDSEVVDRTADGDEDHGVTNNGSGASSKQCRRSLFQVCTIQKNRIY